MLEGAAVPFLILIHTVREQEKQSLAFWYYKSPPRKLFFFILILKTFVSHSVKVCASASLNMQVFGTIYLLIKIYGRKLYNWHIMHTGI